MNTFFSILLNGNILTWQAILDIILMTSIIFFLFRTLIHLGTWKIFAGILFAIFIFLIASLLNLNGIEWVYRNVSHVAVLALIVIFQPELRKVFERAVSVRGSRVTDRGKELSDMVADCMWKLAKQHRGAIVVFPGKEPILEWISGGNRLNAEASPALIMSIFDPNSPGHDGALIIENGRLSRFGVRLPVSQSNRLSEDYGTRHHAAMGLVEKSDALSADLP